MAFSFLDFIFPKRCVSCGSFKGYICGNCVLKIKYIEDPVCPVCQRRAFGGRTHPGCSTKYGLDGLIVGFSYKGPIKLAVRSIKYRWIWDIGERLVELFSKNLWRFDIPSKYDLVPIPLHRRRENWRGFNQAELICKILSGRFGTEYKNLLVRHLETKTQVGLSKQERRDNIKDAFLIKTKISTKPVILVDDVFTTGATMNEACKVLKKAGVGEVWGMAIALG